LKVENLSFHASKSTQLTDLDMRLFVTSILAEEPWKYDSKVIPIPWRLSEEELVKSKLSSGGLTLAYYSSNGVVSKF
jgi:amidase